MKVASYLHSLSELGRKFGIGLSGHIQLYQLASEDQFFDYSADVDGRVVLGSTWDADADTGARAGRDAQRCLNADAPTNV